MSTTGTTPRPAPLAAAQGTDVDAKKYVGKKSKNPSYEDTMPKAQVDLVWTAIYKAAGANQEPQHDAVRVAVYGYGARNGTVSVGAYRRSIETSDGLSFDSAVIPRAAKDNIRQFYRGNMNDSYTALKESGELADDDRFMTRVLNKGVPSHAYIALCDWMKDCPQMTATESEHHLRLFSLAVHTANIGRGGSLEDVKASRVEHAELGAVAAPVKAQAIEGKSMW